MTINFFTYTGIENYSPTIGDFVIWQGWFTTWYGVVTGISSDEIVIVFEGTPKLLLTIDSNDKDRSTYKFTLDEIKLKKTKYLYIFNGKVWFI